MEKIGFQFKKTSKPKSIVQLLPANNKITDQEVEKNDEIDFVTSIDDRTIKGTKPIASDGRKAELVIPLIKVNNKKCKFDNDNFDKNKEFNNTKKESIKVEIKEGEDIDEPTDLLSKAKQELLNESKKLLENETDDKNMSAYQSLLINKFSDNTNRPEEPKLEDYEKIPVEAFGAAMLRGMGWKEGDPIGGINKAVTPVIEPQLRTKSLGLGAEVHLKKQLEEKSNANNVNPSKPEQIIRKGCHVCVEFGRYKGYYGIVENIGDENDDSTYSIKLTLSLECIQLPQKVLRIVTKKEYDLESKVLNKNKYDEYKKKEEKGNHSTESSVMKKSKNYDKSDDEVWIIPRIRAQIIDKNYKNGKYYKDKIVLLETNGRECIGRTKDRKTLNNLHQSMLRTVIRSDTDQVMILRGKHKGQLAKVKNIDWKRDMASISLTDSISKPFSIPLDDISELYDD